MGGKRDASYSFSVILTSMGAVGAPSHASLADWMLPFLAHDSTYRSAQGCGHRFLWRIENGDKNSVFMAPIHRSVRENVSDAKKSARARRKKKILKNSSQIHGSNLNIWVSARLFKYFCENFYLL